MDVRLCTSYTYRDAYYAIECISVSVLLCIFDPFPSSVLPFVNILVSFDFRTALDFGTDSRGLEPRSKKCHLKVA